MRLIRVMCSGRVDLEFVFRAFSKRMDGVFIGGCRLNECNYVTQGNYHALSMTLLGKKIMKHIGLDPERLRIAFMSAGDGILFAEVTNDFVQKVKELGPLGQGEGLDGPAMQLKLEAVTKLIPYIRLVERERLRVPVQSEKAYQAFFDDDAVDKVIRETIMDRLTISQIVLLLREGPLPTGEIARKLGLSPSEVSKYLNSSSRQGLVHYDQNRKMYMAA
jgi:F420-non-reducing hydrogenase iron-sulfur subunit